MTKEEKCNEDYKQQPSFVRIHQLPFIEGWMAGYERAQSEFKNLGIGDVMGRSEQFNCEHEWGCFAFDHFGFPLQKECLKCGEIESI